MKNKRFYKLQRALVASCLAIFLASVAGVARAAGPVWPPIAPEDLAMKEHPTLKGAPAMILLREERSDDADGYTDAFVRIKVFTNEGKPYADVEIPYIKEIWKVEQLAARTVQPDGQEIPFHGEIYDKLVAKARGVKIQTKTFTLPEVRAGSILDYRYRLRRVSNFLLSPTWYLQLDLFTRHASFSLRPYPRLSVYWVSSQLPAGVAAALGKDHFVHLEMDNVPPFPSEEFMPPAESLKMRVEFFYSGLQSVSPDAYWKSVGSAWYAGDQEFIGKSHEAERAVAEVVSANESAEVKLRKLYARALRIRNLSFERERTEAEAKREHLEENKNVDDVLKHGYGYSRQINYALMAMARAAGMEASTLWLCRRSRLFFNPKLLDFHQLNDQVVLVRADAQSYYLDPGLRFSSFGMLTWGQTSVDALVPLKEGYRFETMPEPKSAEARVSRKAQLRLTDSGALEGTAEITFYGREALDVRLDAWDEDEAGRKKLLEERVKGWLPEGAKVELGETSDLLAAEDSLRVQCKITIPDAATTAGRRLLLSPGVFQSGVGTLFQHSTRVHPIYFAYPYQRDDDVTIELPSGTHVENIPEPRRFQEEKALNYEISRERQGSALHLHRRFALEGYYFSAGSYPGFRDLFSRMKRADDEPVVLQLAAGADR